MWIASHTQRTITTLQGSCHLPRLGPPLSQSAVPTISLSISARRRGKVGLTTGRVWSGRDCFGWHATLYLSRGGLEATVTGIVRYMQSGCPLNTRKTTPTTSPFFLATPLSGRNGARDAKKS